jgi:predicted nucleic acid-binding protein
VSSSYEPNYQGPNGEPLLSAIPAKPYGATVAGAGYSRRKLLDRMIAAQALVHRATLVSFNHDDFADISRLSSLAWRSR